MRFNVQPYNRTAPSEDIAVSHRLSEVLAGWAAPPVSFRFLRLSFNHQPYNRPLQAEENIAFRANMREQLTGWARIGADYAVRHRLNENLSGNMRLAAGIRIAVGVKETLSGHADLLIGHKISVALGEVLIGAFHMGADITVLPTSLTESLRGLFHLSANIYPAISVTEQLTGIVHMGANIYPCPALYEVLNGYANIRNIAEYVTIITDPIPAGGVLVIDAANYTVTLRTGLNTKDVIYWHKGDWLNVGRGTIRFTLSSIGSNAYNWEVFYHALYL